MGKAVSIGYHGALYTCNKIAFLYSYIDTHLTQYTYSPVRLVNMEQFAKTRIKKNL